LFLFKNDIQGSQHALGGAVVALEATPREQVNTMRIAIVGLVLLLAAPATAAMDDAERCRIIRQDIREYLGTGHPCPCPYSPTRVGSMCGNRAAWAKPEGNRRGSVSCNKSK
jgi:hypothetical protein